MPAPLPPLRVAVYALALNERANVERFMASCAGADLVVVADTGSTDGTPEALSGAGAMVHRIAVSPWRFDDARNATLALVPHDIGVCVSLDMDEVLSPGWRDLLDRAWVPGTTRVRYPYVWSHSADGAPAVRFYAEKIHARHGYRWRAPCHEGLFPDRIDPRTVTVEDLRIDHWPDASKPRSEYLPLLEAAVREDPDDARSAHYYARELFFHARHAVAEAEFHRHLALPGAIWGLERCASMRYIAKCRIALGDLRGAASWLRQACIEAPEARDPWVDLAEALYLLEDWVGCRDAAIRALLIRQATADYINDPRSDGPLPHDLASIAAWRMGLREEALLHAEAAASVDPRDGRLADNVVTIRKIIERGRETPVPPCDAAGAAGAAAPRLPQAADHPGAWWEHRHPASN
ncbi:MAG: hypothetical protein ABI369_11890 [Acetobacteraceae bacterium]